MIEIYINKGENHHEYKYINWEQTQTNKGLEPREDPKKCYTKHNNTREKDFNKKLVVPLK
jgi:hypothetical protein